MKHLILIIVLLAWSFSCVWTQQNIKVELPNGDVMEAEIIFQKKDSLNGKVIAVYSSDSSKVAFSGSFVNGKPNAQFLYYYPNGKYRQTMMYGYGSLHGDYTVYNQEGKIIVKGKYKNGLKHGYWIDRENHYVGRFKKGIRAFNWKKTKDNGKGAVERWRYRKGELVRGNEKTVGVIEL